MSNESNKSILLRRARIIATDKIIAQADLLLQKGRIAAIRDSASTKALNADIEIDLDGLTLFPGFIDIHIHGAAGVDAMDASSDDLGKVAGFLARHGVTAWLPTLVPAAEENYRRAIAAISGILHQQSDETGSTGARALGVHYEGPFVNGEQCGALHHEHFRTFSDAADLDGLPIIPNNAVHFMTLAPEIAGGINLIKALTSRDWIASIGHTRAGIDVLNEALAAGARHMTHFMNAMTPLHHRAPGPVGWGLINDEVTCDVIADGVHLDRSILKLILRAKGAERLSLISDAIAAAGLGDGDYQIWGEKIAVRNGKTQNARGHIAGSVSTMLDGVRMMLSLGISEPEAARMSSLNPARLLRIDHDCGSIEEGKRADLVALDNTLNVQLTIIGGNITSRNQSH